LHTLRPDGSYKTLTQQHGDEAFQKSNKRWFVLELRPKDHDDIWLVSFMDCDLGYFDLETRVLEPLENPVGPKVLPM
jgi:hypothetical protein